MKRDSVIDISLDGKVLRLPGRGEGGTWVQSALRVAILVAIVAAALAIAGLVLWFALLLIPVAIGAALVAWVLWRWQVWRRAGR